MSDEIYNNTDAWRNNQGVTLPNGEDALYDAGLTPLFLGRTGRYTYEASTVILSRGQVGCFWSTIASIIGASRPFYLAVTSSVIWPADVSPRTNSYPLRCLVSTTNS